MEKEVSEQEENQNRLLNGILDEIDKWQRRPMSEHLKDRCCSVEKERGFQEGLRLSGAIVRARLIKEEEEEEESEGGDE